jgi:NitT/TauT family transport system substrate-binding protein
VAVADWIWVAQQRADGKDYVAFPYSTAVGGILVGADSPPRRSRYLGR